MGKPKVRVSGEDGNIFYILAKASRALRQAGLIDQARELTDKAALCRSYDEALQMVMSYCEVSADSGESCQGFQE